MRTSLYLLTPSGAPGMPANPPPSWVGFRQLLARWAFGLKEGLPHVTGQQANFGMVGSPISQVGDMRSDHHTVEPWGCEVKLSIRRQGIGTLEDPTIAVLDSHSTMAAGVPEEGDQIHLRCEGKPDGLEPEPVSCGLVVEDPGRRMGEIGAIVAKLNPTARMLHRLKLTAVYVDLSVWKIGQSASAVKMEVGHDYVPDCFGAVPEVRQLADSSVLGIVKDAESQSEEADQGCWGDIVVKAEPRIDENETLIGVDQQTGCTHLPAWEPGRHRCAIENADDHDRLSADCPATRPCDPSRLRARAPAALGWDDAFENQKHVAKPGPPTTRVSHSVSAASAG